MWLENRTLLITADITKEERVLIAETIFNTRIIHSFRLLIFEMKRMALINFYFDLFIFF